MKPCAEKKIVELPRNERNVLPHVGRSMSTSTPHIVITRNQNANIMATPRYNSESVKPHVEMETLGEKQKSDGISSFSSIAVRPRSLSACRNSLKPTHILVRPRSRDNRDNMQEKPCIGCREAITFNLGPCKRIKKRKISA